MKSAGLESSSHLARENKSETIKRHKKRLSKSRLINLLNRINFKDGEISLNFKHKKHNNILTLKSKPQFCNKDFLRSFWSEPFEAEKEKKLKNFSFQNLTIADGVRKIQVPAKLVELNERDVYLELPDSCYEIKTREIRRYSCKDIFAQISQDDKILEGNLTSFSAQSFGVNLQVGQSFHGNSIDVSSPVKVVLKHNSELIFSGNCNFIRQNTSSDALYLVLEPIELNIQLFKPKKEVRNERLILSPLPNIIFTHPLTRTRVNLDLINISGTGFAVEEDGNSAVLMPGMVIPELMVEFAPGVSVGCKAQVLYRLPMDDHVICGIAIVDMSVQGHINLSSILHKAKNKHSYISSTNVDLDALWDFFFDTGFIYPEKYAHILEQKAHFHSLYKKLYNEPPQISRHVIYQDKGKIYGHVSMFRYYRTTWLMHHHAAIRSTKHKAGLVVMLHVLEYISECHALASGKMDYIACYFRPNNKFANKVFGGAARALDNPRKCSLDEFTYLHYEPDPTINNLPKQWSITSTSREDLAILSNWYKKNSGGLMLVGLDLDQDAEAKDKSTCHEYAQAGFKRSRKLFSLKKDDQLLAIIVENHSDLGLNMSDLTNGIQVIILDETAVTDEQIYRVLTEHCEHYEQKEVAVLVYPKDTADKLAIRSDKTYVLTVLDLDYISPYLLFMQTLTTHKQKKIKNIS